MQFLRHAAAYAEGGSLVADTHLATEARCQNIGTAFRAGFVAEVRGQRAEGRKKFRISVFDRCIGFVMKRDEKLRDKPSFDNTISDANLLAAARRERLNGRSDAFEEIMHRYERLIFYVARRYFALPEDAMDASQEAAIKIYNGLPRVELPETGNLKAWICKITARTCLDALRKRRPEQAELTEETSPATAPSAEENAAANERVREILDAIKKLPDDHRMTIILRDMQGLSYEELAGALGVSIGTVKSRLSRARDGLKKALSRG